MTIAPWLTHHQGCSPEDAVAALRENKLLLINGISFADAERLLTALADSLGLSMSSDHHFNNMGNPFRIAVSEVFHEVSKYGGHSIFFHNENAYSQDTPEVTCFYCQKNSEFGGENVFLENSVLDHVDDSLKHLLSDLYVKRTLHFGSHDEFNARMSKLVNFQRRGINTIEQYVQYLGQFTEFLAIRLMDTQLQVVYRASLYKQSALDGRSYLQVPSDGSCRVSFHLQEFCEQHDLFFNPMFGYLEKASAVTPETEYFTDSECTRSIDLNRHLFEMALVFAYTHARPVKLGRNSLLIFNNKSWMHSVNAPGVGREMFVSYAYTHSP